MVSMIGPHWIAQHRSADDAATFARWNPWAVKLLTNDETIPYVEDIPAHSKIVVRHYPTSDQLDRAEQTPFGRRWFADEQDAAQTGIRIAATMKRIADWAASRGIDRDRLLFEGPLNEPNLWAGESPILYATCCRWFLEQMHVYGLYSVVGLFGVGWPGNDGPDTPVNWDFFRPVAALMRPGDYIGVHEYWSLNGPQELWRWWAGRFLQCPYMVPILVTECGVDTGVANIRPAIGWHGLPGSFEQKAQRYVSELRWYAEQCKADGRVKAIFPFTHDYASNEWEKFNTRLQPFLDAFFAQPAIEPPTGGGSYPPPPVEPPVNIEAQLRNAAWNKAYPSGGIAYNANAAFAIYARQHGLGCPVTGEFELSGYVAQGFADAVLYAKRGDWGRIAQVSW